MKPLDLARPVQTRTGYPVTLLKTDLRRTYPLIGYYTLNGEDRVGSWTAEGQWSVESDASGSDQDLINVPDIVRRYYPVSQNSPTLQFFSVTANSAVDAVGFESVQDCRDSLFLGPVIEVVFADGKLIETNVLPASEEPAAKVLNTPSTQPKEVPTQYLILEMDGPFDPETETVYDALDRGANLADVTRVDPRDLVSLTLNLHRVGQFDASDTDSDLEQVKSLGRTLTTRLADEGRA